MANPLYNQGGYNEGNYDSGQAQRYFPETYYQGLLTSLYKDSTNFNAWLKAVLDKGQDISIFLDSASFAFSIGAARGDQLDRLGSFLGISRTLPFQPSGGVDPVLSDQGYTTLLRARIYAKQYRGQRGQIYSWWPTVFPSTKIVLFDQQNMTVIVRISGLTSTLWQEIISNHLVIPEAQAVRYIYSFGPFPLFGLDQNNALVAGVDVGELI